MMPISRSPIRACRLLAMLACIVLASPSHASGAGDAASPGFLPGLPDVPLMHGLKVEEDGTLVFDKPNGRIVETSASGVVTAPDLVSYYRAALPELGWRAGREGARAAGRLSFLREGEVLQIEYASRGRLLDVRFFLSPD